MAVDILNITDGTTTLNLYNLNEGYSVSGWQQAIAQYKGGGVFAESSLSAGRQLILRRHANVAETIPLHVFGYSPDVAARILRDLVTLLEKAADYWELDWQNEPVWLEAQDRCETERRYGLVVTGQIPSIPDQHSLGRVRDTTIYDDLSLVIERQHWTENAPGTGTAVALSMIQSYDGRTVGNVDSTGTREPTTNQDQAYIANKHNIAQLTDVYIRDVGAGWSANLMDAALPFDFLPAVPAVNDHVVFGIDTAVANSGPFCSLVFDISIAQVDLTMVWEYWNGAAWFSFAGLQFQDNTDGGGTMLGDPFDTTGRGTVHWDQPSDWATGDLSVIVGGAGAPVITGYWIRARVTAIGAAPAPPRQQNRDIYTITWGGQEILADVTTGDLASLAEWRFLNTSDMLIGNDTFATDRIVAGLRSYDRGANFQSYLNFGNTQLITGQTNAVVSGAHVASSRDITGNTFRYTPAAASTVSVYYMELSTTLAAEFYGTYRVFLRFTESAGTGTIGLQLSYRLGAVFWEYATSDYVALAPGSVMETVDMGVLTVPSANVDVPGVFRIYLEVTSAGAPYPTLDFRDIVLIPADEWIVDVQAPSSEVMGIEKYLSLNSISWPKNWLNAHAIHVQLLALQELWSARTGDAVQLVKRGERQRIWMMAINEFNDAWYGIAHWAQCFKNDRFLGPRGDAA